MSDVRCISPRAFFLQTFREINTKYPRLFGKGDESDEQGDASNGKRKKTFLEHWGWFVTINNMANNDRQKWDYFFEMNIINFLNSVCFYIDKQNFENERIKRGH